MVKEKRKAVRRTMRYTAWIVATPGRLHGCSLADVSDTGCRLDVENSSNIPDTFTLWLSSNGAARRTCRVVWRTAHQMGVAFDRAVFEQVPLAPTIPVKIVSTEATEPVETVTIDEPVKTV